MKRTARVFSLLLVLILCLSVLPVGAAAANFTGWQKIEGEWYYIDNGAVTFGWKQIDGAWYYFVPEWGGIMLTGWMNTDPNYFNSEDGPYTGDWYHFSSSGTMDAGKWVKETYTYEGKTYTDWYYMLSSGKGAMGWQKIGGVWYYFDPDTAGAMVSGSMYEIGGRYYWFKDSGALYTGWKKVPFSNTDGEEWEAWMYFTSDGAVAEGWKQIDGSWYYFDGYEMLTGGPHKIGGRYYYFKDSGALYTGWKQFDGSWWYFTSDGAVSGWQKIGGIWYYFSGHAMATGPLEIGDRLYFFKTSGALFTGWKESESGWMYFTSNGAVESGWMKIGGKWYQFDSRICLNP